MQALTDATALSPAHQPQQRNTTTPRRCWHSYANEGLGTDFGLRLTSLGAYSVDCLLCRDPRPTDGTLVPIPPPGPIAWGEIQRERHLGGFASVASCGCLGANSGHGMGIGPIRVLKDERVVDAVSLALRLLPTPCRGTICTFDLARLPNSHTCRAYAHVSPTHIDIYVLPFSNRNTRWAVA